MLQLNTIDKDTFSLLKKLSQLKYLNNFALAGGTSLALQLGHRISIDLDFFTLKAFDSAKLLEDLNCDFKIYNASTDKNTLSIYIEHQHQKIKVEFLRHNYKLLNNYLQFGGIKLYSIEDIAAMKLNAIANRGSKKDFYDINELLKSFSLKDLIEMFKSKYQHFNAFSVVKSLDYFEDADIEPNPLSLRKESWNQIKKNIKNAIQEAF